MNNNLPSYRMHSDNNGSPAHTWSPLTTGSGAGRPPSLMDQQQCLPNVVRVSVKRDNGGYGMKVSGDNPVYVQSVKEGGPAEKAGLHAGDRIIQVNGANVMHLTHTDVVDLIKSSAEVLLTVQQRHSLRSPNSRPNTIPSAARITSPQPVNHEKQYQLQQEREQYYRLMIEKEQHHVEKLRSQIAVSSNEKKSNELAKAEKNLKTLQDNLLRITDQQSSESVIARHPSSSSQLSLNSPLKGSFDQPPPLPKRNKIHSNMDINSLFLSNEINANIRRRNGDEYQESEYIPPDVPPPLPPRTYPPYNLHTDKDAVNSIDKQMAYPLVATCTSLVNDFSIGGDLPKHSRTKSSPESLMTLSTEIRNCRNDNVNQNNWQQRPGTPPGTPPPPYPTIPLSDRQDRMLSVEMCDGSFDLINTNSPDDSFLDIMPNSPMTPQMNSSPIRSTNSRATQQNIISMEDDDMSDLDIDQSEDHGHFKSLSRLWEHLPHLAVFMNYILSNSDPNSLLFYLLTDLYKEGNAKEMRKWAFEIHSCFLVPGAPLRLNNVDENIAREIDEDLTKEYEKEEIMRKIFWKARSRAKEELTRQLTDFQQKRKAGLGTIYGPTDNELKEHYSDKTKEAKLYETLFLPKLEMYLEEFERDTSDIQCYIAAALITVLTRIFKVRSPNLDLDRVPTFVNRDRSLKYKLMGRYSRKINNMGHQFVPHQYYTVITCRHCHQIIYGISPQGYQCSCCFINLHRGCVKLFDDGCPGPINKKDRGIRKLIGMRHDSADQNKGRKVAASHFIQMEKDRRHVEEKDPKVDVSETEEDAATPTDEHDGVVLRNNNGVRASDVVVKRYSDSFVIENGVTESDPVVEGKSSTPTPLTRALSGFFVLDQTKKANRRLSDLFRPVSAKLSGSTESLKMSTKAEKHCISDKKDKKDSKQIDQSAKGRSNQKNDSAKKISQTKPHEADKPSGTDNTTNSYLKRVKSKIYKSKSDDASKIEVDGKYKKLKPKKSLDLNSRIPEEDVPSTPSPGEVKSGQTVTRKGSDRRIEGSCEEVGRAGSEADCQSLVDRQDDAQMPIEKSDAVTQSESSTQTSGAKKKTSHINRSESVKEQPDKNRKQQQRRNISDPSHNFNASSETETDRQHSISKNVESGSSSNSNLSSNGRLSESPSTSMDVHQATVRTQSDSDSDMDAEADPLNWQELVTEEELRKLNPNEKKRQEVINELFLTEASHVRMLKVLYKKFYKTLFSNQILKSEEMNLLFPNIKELLDIHQDINKEMRRIRKEDPLVRQVGDMLLAIFTGNQGEALQKASATFCERQQLALEFIKKRRERDSKFDTILTDCEKSRQCRRLQLQAIIPAQMQRITRYPLLLERLVKSVEAAEKVCSDYKDELIKLKQVHHQSKEILSHVNDAAKLAHNRHRLEEIQRHLEIPSFRTNDQPNDNDFRNIDLTRYKLILEGGLYLRRPNKAPVLVHVLLLEEMIVILQKENDRFILKFFQSGNPGQPPLSPIIKMNTLLVRENAVCKNALFLVNTSTTSSVCMYDLQADDESKRETWRKHFSDAADAYNRREGKLNRESTITTSSQDAASDSDANSIKEMSTENENLPDSEVNNQSPDTPETPVKTDDQNPPGEENSEDQTPDMTPGGGIQLTSKVTAEDWPLIQPSQVNIVVPPVHTAESMLTPLEQIRRKDALVKQALAEKENLVADLLSIPREHFEHIADMAVSASDVNTSGNSDITDRLLASVFQVNLLQKAINEAFNISESEVVAAKGGKRPVCSSQEPHYSNEVRPVTPSIPASHVRDIVTSLSGQLTTLLSDVKSVEEDRDRLRKELHKMKEKLHEEHNLHNSVPFDDAASDGSAQEVFCEASSE